MRINPLAAITIICLLVTSLVMPVLALPGNAGSPDTDAGSTGWNNKDGFGFELSEDENNAILCEGLNNKGQCEIP